MSLKPASMESTVDFPQPEWPIRHTNSPRWMVRLKFFTMITGPLGVGYFLVRLESST